MAQKYLDATGRYDIPEACLYCTQETADGLRTLDTTLLLRVDSSFIQQNTPATILITSVTIDNDSTATIAYHKKTPIQEFDGELKMVKHDGKWMAHAPVKIPAILRKQHQTFNPKDIEQKIAAGEITFHTDSTPFRKRSL